MNAAAPSPGAEAALYQELVLEHKRAPRHYGHLDAPTQRARGRNPQCGDDVSVELRMDANAWPTSPSTARAARSASPRPR